MAELTCSVNTCASHNGGYCCRNSIKIDGHSAVMKDQTFCGSFQQKTGGAVNAACVVATAVCAVAAAACVVTAEAGGTTT